MGADAVGAALTDGPNPVNKPLLRGNPTPSAARPLTMEFGAGRAAPSRGRAMANSRQIFRLVNQGPYVAVVEDGSGVVSEGEDLRNEREALRFLEELGRERGIRMIPDRDESGHLVQVRGEFQPETVGFSWESLREIDEYKLALSAKLRDLAAERATAARRRSVTDEDVRQSLRDAVERLLAEEGISRG